MIPKQEGTLVDPPVKAAESEEGKETAQKGLNKRIVTSVCMYVLYVCMYVQYVCMYVCM